MVVILGGGLAGLATAYHLHGKREALVLEAKDRPFGHVRSTIREGFTWDEGPHLSFTKSDYVRDLFTQSVGGEYLEYDVVAGNYYAGHWIEHPAQCNLHQVPEPLRSQAVESFLEARRQFGEMTGLPADYESWLRRAFGDVFAEHFPLAYTEKYWTVPARHLTTKWIGGRVYYPAPEDVLAGARGPLPDRRHYITRIRYPRRGGYQAFAEIFARQADCRFGVDICSLDLRSRKIRMAGGSELAFDQLVSTIPLPHFVSLCVGVPERVREAARALSCSQLLLINVTAPHETQRRENWIYVYDRELLSTRISCTEKLSPGNAPVGSTGVQAEVYASKHRPFPASSHVIAARVVEELQRLGLVRAPASGLAQFDVHTHTVPWANVIFHHDTRPALEEIFTWLEGEGLARNSQDLEPMTNWDETISESPQKKSRLWLAGRFAEWKYFWTDDCVLRGRALGIQIE